MVVILFLQKFNVKQKGSPKRRATLLGPANIKHLEIVLHDSDLLFLVRLIEVLQDDGNVHINYNHVADYNKACEIGNCQQWMATIAVLLGAEGRVAVRWLDHQRLQHVVPAGGRHESGETKKTQIKAPWTDS